jgi:hypothetical protein
MWIFQSAKRLVLSFVTLLALSFAMLSKLQSLRVQMEALH